jgi:teichuronic acid exporter
MKDLVAKSVFWIVWSRGGMQVLSFMTTLLVARLLSPIDYGLLAMAAVWTGTLSMLADLGLSATVVQYRDLTEAELNLCFWTTLTMTVGGYLGLYVTAPAIARWFDTPALENVLRVSGVALPLLAFRIVPDGLLRKHVQFDKLSRIEITSSFLSLPVMFLLAWYGFGVWSLVLGALLQTLVGSLGLFYYVRWYPGLRVKSNRFRELARYSLATLGGRVGWSTYQQADSFVLGKVSGDAVLGLYSMAMQIALLPVTKVSVVVNQLAFPVLAGLQADPSAMRAAFMRGVRLVVCITAPLALGLIIVADDLISVALTDKWMAAVPVLQVLAACSLIRSVEVLLPPVLFARYRSSFLFWWTLSLLAIMPFVFWFGAAWLGALGVALAWLMAYPVLMFRMAQEGMDELGLSWKMLWRGIRPILAAAAIMAGAVFLLRIGMAAEEGGHRALRLAVCCVIGALVYGMGLYWRGGAVVRELQEVLGWILHRGRAFEVAK